MNQLRATRPRISARARTAAVLWALLSTLAAAAAVEAGGEWRHDPIWDDGNAEFCAYEVEWRRYGVLNPGRALLILVKEPWAPDLEVKADTPRADGFDVLKLNHIRDVPTGIYTYHQMASVFVRRDSGALQKLAVTSSEGCGISTAHMVDGRLETRSYFDGQGERERQYPDGALPEDGLAASLRDWVTGPAPERLRVLPSLMTGRFPSLEPVSYRLSRSPGAVEVPAGAFETVELRLTGGDGPLSFHFAAAPPHPLVRYVAGDGTRYELAKCERIPYWSMNRPGGEAWLPRSVP